MTDLAFENAPSPNWDSRDNAAIDMLVLHYTGMADGPSALARLRDPAPRWEAYIEALPPAMRTAPASSLARVSAHYVVETDGRIFQLVEEAHRAWHAGVSSWAGATDINARSIGIEIVNGGHDFPDADGQPPAYPQAQMAAVLDLVRACTERRAIAPWRVVGHCDVAPDRKQDPGEHFPWLILAAQGLALAQRAPSAIGAAPRILARAGAAGPSIIQLQIRLAALGYGVAPSGGFDERTQAVATAFQRRFRPAAFVDGSAGCWTQADEEALSGAFLSARGLALQARKAGHAYAEEPPADPG